MMFRSVQADEESGSDWDDTPTTTPTHLHTTPDDTHSQQVSRPHKAHVTSHSPSSHSRPSHKTPSTHSQQSHKTPTRPHPSHKSPRHHTDRLKVTDQRSDIELIEHRPPRTLPPIETTVTTSVASPSPVVSVPLTPAAINPVYNEPNEQEFDDPLRESMADHDTFGLLLDKRSVLEFAPVSDVSAGILTSNQDPPPYSYMGGIAQRSEQMSKRCTEEVFSCMRIVSDFIITFTLGLLYYVFYHVARKLCCGAAHILSDSLTTPLINTCFNGLIWPICSCLYQLTKAIVLVLTPIVGLVGELLVHVSNMLRSFRLVDIHLNNSKTQQTPLQV